MQYCKSKRKNNHCQHIHSFMKEHNASVMPLKTRAIAEECKIFIYMALNYMRGLERQRKVTPDSRGKGRQLTGIY